MYVEKLDKSVDFYLASSRCTFYSAPDCLVGVDIARHHLFIKEKIEVEKLTSTQDAPKPNFNPA